MIPNCRRHRFEVSEDECRECGNAYCGSCLVYPNGGNARPLCVPCALETSAVRGSTQDRPRWRARRARSRMQQVLATQTRGGDAEAPERVPAATVASVEVPDPESVGWISLNAGRWDLGAI